MMMDQDSLFTVTKPAYTVPTMAECLSKDNGLTAVSTFSGCGGSSLGLKRAGWRIPYAVEFIPAARETYMANFPTTFVDGRDIRTISGAEILEHIGVARGELDLFEGSPPCSSFSTVNRTARNQGSRIGNMKVKNYSDGVKQTTDDLFGEWLRLVSELRPKAILAENVVGLQQATIKGETTEVVDDDGFIMDGEYTESDALEDMILTPLRELGYHAVALSPVKATEFGAATQRNRLYIHGFRSDLGIFPTKPQTSPYRYTIREAIAEMPEELNKYTGRVEPPMEQLEFCISQVVRKPSIMFPWSQLSPGEWATSPFQLYRCTWDDNLPAITAGYVSAANGPLHPEVPRLWSIDEIKWMSTFPVDFVLTGSPEQQYERIGRAVVPSVYESYGKMLAGQLGGAV